MAPLRSYARWGVTPSSWKQHMTVFDHTTNQSAVCCHHEGPSVCAHSQHLSSLWEFLAAGRETLLLCIT